METNTTETIARRLIVTPIRYEPDSLVDGVTHDSGATEWNTIDRDATLDAYETQVIDSIVTHFPTLAVEIIRESRYNSDRIALTYDHSDAYAYHETLTTTAADFNAYMDIVESEYDQEIRDREVLQSLVEQVYEDSSFWCASRPYEQEEK